MSCSLSNLSVLISRLNKIVCVSSQLGGKSSPRFAREESPGRGAGGLPFVRGNSASPQTSMISSSLRESGVQRGLGSPYGLGDVLCQVLAGELPASCLPAPCLCPARALPATLRYATLRYATLRCVASRRVVSRRVASRRVASRRVASR